MTRIQQLHLIWYIVLTVAYAQLSIIAWLAIHALRRRGARRSAADLHDLLADDDPPAADLPAAVREDPDLGPVMAVRMSVGDSALHEVGVINVGPEFAFDLVLLMRALAVEFENDAAELPIRDSFKVGTADG